MRPSILRPRASANRHLIIVECHALSSSLRAKRGNPEANATISGLPRRCAPRNDGELERQAIEEFIITVIADHEIGVCDVGEAVPLVKALCAEVFAIDTQDDVIIATLLSF